MLSTVATVAELVGLACLVVGFMFVWAPLGWLAGGAALVLIGWALDR